jgi:putative DNA primase/helicase
MAKRKRTAARRQQYNLTQLGNAQRLVTLHGQDIRYCFQWKSWLVWDGTRWAADNTGQLERFAQEAIQGIYADARAARLATMQDALRRHARQSESKSAIEGLLYFCRSQAGIAVRPEDLDADRYLFNCANSTLDLRSGDLRSPQRADLITKLSPVDYDANATCPTWESFLNKILGGDAALVTFVQRVLGYALTGDVTEKALFLFLGSGNNGKTTLLEAIRHVMGYYAGVIDIDALMQDAGNAERERATADLCGKRFVTCSEVEEGRRLNESKVKQLTGMGRQTARRIYGNPFEFDPMYKLVVDANHKPVIRGTDEAIWCRIRVVPFNVAIPKAEQDPNLLAKLKAEAAGILAWAVRGCLAWQAHGLNLPDAVKHAGDQYLDESDLVQDFIDDCCQVEPTHRVTFKVLYQAFVDWCKDMGEQAISQTAFGHRLTAKGFPQTRSSSSRSRTGLRIKGTFAKVVPDKKAA